MTLPSFSLNVNGNWIDVRTEGFWKPKVIVLYNGEPLITERWTGERLFELKVTEEGSRVVYNIEIILIQRSITYIVRRNGILLLVTEGNREWADSRER